MANLKFIGMVLEMSHKYRLNRSGDIAPPCDVLAHEHGHILVLKATLIHVFFHVIFQVTSVFSIMHLIVQFPLYNKKKKFSNE